MVSFKLSAPGKIILFGEHSVVYGKTAIAASVGLRTHLKFQEKDDKNITINLKAIDLVQSFTLDEINEFVHNLSTTFDVINPETIDHDRFLHLTMNFLEQIPNWGLFSDSQKSALTSFIYILSGISIFTKFHITSGFLIDLTSEINIGSGLGSSASFSVVLAGCFIKYMRNVISDFDQKLLEDVSRWAFCSEKIMHGTPSGLDNYLCTFGSIVQYRKNEKPLFLNLSEEYQVILIDTTVPRQGKIMISNIRTLFNNHTTIVNTILEAMDNVAQNAVYILASNDADKNTKLKDLIKINQGLLFTLGVSHPNINKICEIASKKNFAAKLTGAGGGGYCIVMSLDKNEDVQLLIDEFKREGFPCILTTLGTTGLKVD